MEYLQLRDVFLAKLADEQLKRTTRKPNEWIEAERTLMVGLINGVRQKLGLPLIDLAIFIRVDNTCTGADYAAKLALRSAELAMGLGSFEGST